MSGIKAVLNLLPPGGARVFARVIRGFPTGVLKADADSVKFLLTLASSRRYMVTSRRIGYPTFKLLYDKAGANTAELELLLDALEDVRPRMNNDPKRWKQFLDSLKMNEAAAWKRLDELGKFRRETAVKNLTETLVREGLSPVLRTQAQKAIDMLRESPDPEHRRLLVGLAEMAEQGGKRKEGREITSLLSAIHHLDKTRLDGIAAIHAMARRGRLPPEWVWEDFLVTGYNFVLEPLGQVAPFVDRGLDKLFQRGLVKGPGIPGESLIELQGMWGHLWAAADAVKRFEKDHVIRLEFEIEEKGPLSKRFIDTRIKLADRTVDLTLWNDPLFYERRIYQEVKTNLGYEPSLETRQMRKDLARHATREDMFRNMLYSYHPSQTEKLGDVKEALRKQLKTKTIQGILAERGITPQEAEQWLEQVIDQAVVAYEIPEKRGRRP